MSEENIYVPVDDVGPMSDQLKFTLQLLAFVALLIVAFVAGGLVL